MLHRGLSRGLGSWRALVAERAAQLELLGRGETFMLQRALVPALMRWRERIVVDGVRESLLELVHGMRGSFVDADRVVAVIPRPWRGLEEAADKVVALAEALDAQASLTSKA